MTLHMYVWSRETMFFAVAQAESVAEARIQMLSQIGADSSTPKRLEAKEWIERTQPVIWYDRNAEFALTDSAELEEQTVFLEKEQKRIHDLEAENAKLREALAVAQSIVCAFTCALVGSTDPQGDEMTKRHSTACAEITAALHPEKSVKA